MTARRPPVWRRSLTVRLTVLATLTTAAVLTVLLAGLLALFAGQLDRSVDAGLRARLADLQVAVAAGDVREVTRESFAELYHDGRPVASSTGLDAPLLADLPDCPSPPGFEPSAVAREIPVAGREDALPVRALAACRPDGSVIAVGTSVEAQREARNRLLVLLAFVAPLLLAVVAGVVGRAVAAALRPVDELSQQARRITAGTALRLPTVSGEDEIARLAATLEAMLGRLGEAFAREQAFVDDASHELRTPIAVLSGELQLALAQLQDGPAVEQSLRAAEAEAQRLRALVDDLLVVARERAGDGESSHSPLAEVLNETAARAARTYEITVTVDCPYDLVLPLRPLRLSRMIDNLLQNAGQAAATQVVVSATVLPDGPETVIEVADDGPGFPVDLLPHAFERFRRADQARARTSGTGLGLAIVAAVAEEAGGAVEAANGGRLGGAVLRVRLPVVPASAGSVAAEGAVR